MAQHSLNDITIITPAYIKTSNYIPWLIECVESTLNTRHIIVDDCSHVKIAHILQKYPHVTYIRLDKRSGPAVCRNVAVANCVTPLIFPLDCDDVLAENALTSFLNYWKHYNVPIYSDLFKFGIVEDKHFILKDISDKLLKGTTGFAAVSVLHSVEQHNEIGGWETLQLYEDGYYNAKLFHCFGGKRISMPLVGWRQHPNQRHRNVTQQASSRKYIIELLKGLDTMCCRKQIQRSLNTAQQPALISAQRNVKERNKSMLKVQYLGGTGRGPHNYRTRVTGTLHRIVYGAIIELSQEDYNAASSIFKILDEADDKVEEESKVVSQKVEQIVSKVPEIKAEDDSIPTVEHNPDTIAQSESEEDLIEYPWPMTLTQYSKFRIPQLKLIVEDMDAEEINQLYILEQRRDVPRTSYIRFLERSVREARKKTKTNKEQQ